MTLTDFLLARIAEDETWANACEGLHWEWRGNAVDDLVTPDPFIAEFIDEGADVSLRSVEQFPYGSIPGEGPRFLIHSAEETVATAAGHIARHDPARVLAECEAKRRIVDSVPPALLGMPPTALAGAAVTLTHALKALAMPYADHPDYDPAWKVEW